MPHIFFFEALEKSLKDIISANKNASKKIFGGKIVVFSDDFRKILLVIPRGSIHDIFQTKINASYIWDHFKVLRLTKNMPLQNGSTSSSSEEIKNS